MIEFLFPKGFLWGTGTSASQIEGGYDADGKAMSIWDKSSRQDAEKFWNGDRPDVACDFYHRYRQDVKEMGKLGLKSFRFSISWPRVLPLGRGKVNEKGLDFYDKLIDALLEQRIEPFVDLYHWDLPQALADQKGFKNPGIIKDFENYARLCFGRFGDRVKLWSTVNEPAALACFTAFDPEYDDIESQLVAAENILLMHYAAVGAYRKMECDGKIGAVIAFVPVYSRTLREEDQRAAAMQQEFVCGRWLEPMLNGSYPEKLLRHADIVGRVPKGFVQKLTGAFEPMDFVGINYYYPNFIGHKADGFLGAENAESYYAQTDYGFTVYPQGMHDSLVYVKDRYGDPEIYLTENGFGEDSTRRGWNAIDDNERIVYMREHLRELSRAIKVGANVQGYYYWSHFDTYEGRSGYRYRFGLNNVDFETLERTRRKSWYYYKKCIAANAVD